tara:strand:- start:1279 stop:1644 length:366 start_codon:yes stop_codon:yes gene_type:complete
MSRVKKKTHSNAKMSLLRRQFVSHGKRVSKQQAELFDALHNYEDTSKEGLQQLVQEVKQLQDDVRTSLNEFKRHEQFFLGLPSPCGEATKTCSITQYAGWTNSVLRVGKQIIQETEEKSDG